MPKMKEDGTFELIAQCVIVLKPKLMVFIDIITVGVAEIDCGGNVVGEIVVKVMASR